MKDYKTKEEEILTELDLAFKGKLGNFFPTPSGRNIIIGEQNKFVYNFFLDLEDGYLITSTSIIHLYSDSKRWAIVFETNGYHTRQSNCQIKLIYIGNCIKYKKEGNSNHRYISNSKTIELISETEFRRIENRKGTEMERFELIDPEIKFIEVRNQKVEIEKSESKYQEKLINFREDDNSQNLIGFEDIVRYLCETKSNLMKAKESEINEHLPEDLPKIMEINSFYQKSNYDEENLPSTYETYQLIAKVIQSMDSTAWKPKLIPNNHWTNWESGSL